MKAKRILTAVTGAMMCFGLIGSSVSNITTVNAEDSTDTPTITYYANGGTVNEEYGFEDGFVSDQVILGYKTLPADTYTAPEGYWFKCWVANDDAMTCYDAGEILDQNNLPTALAAVWEVIPHDLTYHANGIDGTDDTQVIKAEDITANPVWLNVSDSTLFTASEGKTFKYWNTEADGSGTTYYATTDPENPVKLDENYPTDLYAIYDTEAAPVESTITYYANGGTVNSYYGWEDGFVMNPETLGYVTLPADSYDAPEGMEFDYWVGNDENLTHYAAGETLDKDNLPTALAAVWKEKTPEPTTTPTTEPTETTEPTDTTDTTADTETAEIPDTSDKTNYGMYAGFGIVALVAAAGIIVLKKKFN